MRLRSLFLISVVIAICGCLVAVGYVAMKNRPASAPGGTLATSPPRASSGVESASQGDTGEDAAGTIDMLGALDKGDSRGKPSGVASNLAAIYDEEGPSIERQLLYAEYAKTFAESDIRPGEPLLNRPQEYYAQLLTPALVVELMSVNHFHVETMVWDDANLGLLRLSTQHNGFREMLLRADLGDGLLAAYDHLTNRLLEADSYGETHDAAMRLGALENVYTLYELKSHVRGREREFFEANKEAIRAYIEVTRKREKQPFEDGALVPFYGGAARPLAIAGAMAASFDPKVMYQIDGLFRSFPKDEAQDRAQLGRFLERGLEILDEGRSGP